MADVWNKFWAYINTGKINPSGFGRPYPWGNTGATAYSSAPIYIGEFGTANSTSDISSTGPGSQGQWFTDLVNFIRSSYNAPSNSSIPVTSLNWTYWALNTEDSHALLGSAYSGLANPTKEYSYLCFTQQGPLAVPAGSSSGQCGSTGGLPAPN